MGYKVRVTTSKHKIIDIKNKYDEIVTYFLGIDIGVRMTSRKTGVKEKAIHFGISGSRSLLKAMQGFLKATDRAGVILNIAKRLFLVNFFLQIPMQEGRLDIHLMDLPFMQGYKGKDKVDGVHFGDG